MASSAYADRFSGRLGLSRREFFSSVSKKDILTDGHFISKIRSQAGGYPDETRIGDLRIPPPSLKPSYYKAYNFLEDSTPPEDWETFYYSLTTGEISVLSKALGRAMAAGFETVGELRDKNEEELQKPKNPGKEMPIISDNAASFLSQAFCPLPYEGTLVKQGEWVVFR